MLLRKLDRIRSRGACLKGLGFVVGTPEILRSLREEKTTPCSREKGLSTLLALNRPNGFPLCKGDQRMGGIPFEDRIETVS